MSQRQEEGRERAQQELYADLRVRSQPLRDQIAALEHQKADIETQIAGLRQKIKDMYEANEDFLTKL